MFPYYPLAAPIVPYPKDPHVSGRQTFRMYKYSYDHMRHLTVSVVIVRII